MNVHCLSYGVPSSPWEIRECDLCCSLPWIFSQRSFAHGYHSSDRLLSDARHRSQDLTQLAQTLKYAVCRSSDGCTHQKLDPTTSSAVSDIARSPSSVVCFCRSNASGRLPTASS